MTPRQFSGIQKEVFGLYRTILREAAKKDRSSNSVESSLVSLWSKTDTTASYAKREFRLQASKVPRKEFKVIEFKIRYGYKQLKMLQMPGVKLVSSS
jgi:hypothetical protein